ncbi:unnamed protein product [Mesocestoides corti]|uniref:Uncharacterized protein n=1 Tax=Mesocestoides corti TaxID=53468 RepID=A0A3P6HUK7_MESCO|nr:unnamed protein product [Mesocestoides corti]
MAFLAQNAISASHLSAPRIQTNPSFKTYKNRFTSLNNLFRWGKAEKPLTTSQEPSLSTTPSTDVSRLREIECQITDLSGALRLRVNQNIKGRKYISSSSSSSSTVYKIKLSIADKSASIISLSSYQSPSDWQLAASGKPVKCSTSNGAAHELVLTCQLVRSKSTAYSLNDPETLLYADSYLETWKFSSTEHVFSIEPCASLITEVSKSEVLTGKSIRKAVDLRSLLTTESQPITVELTLMSTPYIEIEVKWLPLTSIDTEFLEKYPPSRSGFLEYSFAGSVDETSQSSSHGLILVDKRRSRILSPGDAGFDSVRLGPTPTVSTSSAGSAAAMCANKSPPEPGDARSTTLQCTTGSDSSIFQQQSVGYTLYNNGDGNDELIISRNNDGDNLSQDVDGLGALLESVRNDLETLNRETNRFSTVLRDLSTVLNGLHEQLSSSSKFMSIPQKSKLPSGSLDREVARSLSLLDCAIGDGDSPERLTPAIEAWAPPLTSGWDQLDSAIEWHLKNVSFLLQRLASSDRAFIPMDMEDSANKNLLYIREDLLAMALHAQSEILSDITGLALSYAETREPYRVCIHSHCLAFCGWGTRAHLNAGAGPPIFPTSFWSQLIWQTDSSLRSQDGENYQPTLMIGRSSFHEYLLQEYAGIQPEEKDDQSLDDGCCIPLFAAIEVLIEQLTDLDLTDVSPWNEIPLTQLCHRLKVQNFQIAARLDSQILRPGSFNGRIASTMSRIDSGVEASLGVALKYLIEQGRLQHELRESDEEVLFRSLEALVDNLVSGNAATRRMESMTISVTNFICLALTLQHEDASVATFASRAICALEDMTRGAYGIILQNNALPFLRTAGPCCSFLKSLELFSKKFQKGSSKMYEKYYRRSHITSDGYGCMTPVGSAILWGMDPNNMEEYRIAALAAWECLCTPEEASIGRHYRQRQQQLQQQRVDVHTPIHVEVRRMNLEDGSAEVRRLALRILMARKKFRSTATMLDSAH